MTRLSEQLEHEAEIARGNLAADLGELRHRMTPGQILDEVADYARRTPVAEIARNLLREVRENPVPLLLISAGIAWVIIASSRRPRIVVEEGPLETRSDLAVPGGHQWRAKGAGSASKGTAATPHAETETGPSAASGSHPWTLPSAIAATEKV